MATTDSDAPSRSISSEIALLERDDASLGELLGSVFDGRFEVVRVRDLSQLRARTDQAGGIVLLLDGDSDEDMDVAEELRGERGLAVPILFVVSPERIGRLVSRFADKQPVDFLERPAEPQVLSFKIDHLITLGARQAVLERQVGAQSQALESLEQNQMEFSVIFDHAPNMMVLVDEKQRLRRANQAMLELVENDVESLNGKIIGEIFPCINCLDGLRPCGESPECPCTLTQTIAEAFSTGQRQRGVSVSMNISAGARQEMVELLMSATPVVVDGEQLLLVSFEDITSRKQAEDALRRSSEFQRQILNTAATAVFTVDNELRVTSVNEEFTTITGFTSRDVVGEHCSVLRGTPCQNHCGVFDPDTNGSVYRQQCTVTAKDGRRLDIIKNANLTNDESGKVTGAIESFVDVTELVASRKRAETARREIEETNEQLQVAVERSNKMAVAAELASQAKSEFLANMSHEIRTPMNGVLGMTDLLLDTELDKEQRDYAETVKGSAEALLTLINDILDFSKIEAGRLELDPIGFRLSDNLSDTVSSFALRAAEKGIELACYIEPGVPEHVIGDPGRLRQIVVNLIGNAMKFTKQGEVVLRVEKEAESAESVTLHFSVTDTGIGVPEEKRGVIFEVFSQADGSTTRQFGGTGLGLTISSQLVNMMHGKIWVESPAPSSQASEEFPGSVFHFMATFDLPGEDEVGENGAADAELPEGLDVLVVDDNATSREILTDILLSWNMKPVAVASGEEALARIARRTQEGGEPFSLIILDVLMPEMDGFTLAERIKSAARGGDCTIIMLISAGQRGDVARCRELGVAAYLAKPCRQSELRQAVNSALKRKADKPRKGQDPITRHSLREQRQALRILLAEDNPVNQKLALRLLEKRGYKVTVANNGRQAADTFRHNLATPFDVVLMDVQMPEMDGFEATAAIREMEAASGRETPIIAMTAHAMQGYRERCLDAGMNGYVTKPIIAGVMFETIESLAGQNDMAADDVDRQIPPSVPERRESAAPPAAPTPSPTVRAGAVAEEPEEEQLPVFEREVALSRAADDEDLLKELVGMFLEDAPELLSEVQENMAKGDLKVAERHAHSLKGASANLGAEALRAVALEMEVANREEKPEAERAAIYARLVRAYEKLKTALELV